MFLFGTLFRSVSMVIKIRQTSNVYNVENNTFVVVKRHSSNTNSNGSEDSSTFSTPKIVEKTPEEIEQTKLHIEQEETEYSLENQYLTRKESLTARDLAVINRPDLYPKDMKKDRRYNRGVTRSKQDLELLSFLIEVLKPYYRNQIFLSKEFDNVLKKFLGISKESGTTLTDKEKNQALAIALKFLGDSMTMIKNLAPKEFQDSLNTSALPFIKQLDALYASTKLRDKSLPKIVISKYFIQKGRK